MMVILLVNLLFTGLFLWVAYSPYIQPVSHPALACLGLTFPIFLFIEVAFLLFWLLIQQYKAALIALLGLLLGYGPIRTYLPIRMSTDEVPEGSFKLLSYNIMGFDGCKRVKGGNPVLDYLLESQADILCLQEYVTMNHPYLSQGDVEKALSPQYPYHRICSVYDRPALGNQKAHNSKYPNQTDPTNHSTATSNPLPAARRGLRPSGCGQPDSPLLQVPHPVGPLRPLQGQCQRLCRLRAGGAGRHTDPDRMPPGVQQADG